MKNNRNTFSTGLPGLDTVLIKVMPGDNIVWQVDSVEDYKPFVNPFCRHAHEHGKRVVYFRFAQHAQLLPPDSPAEIIRLQPENGFEKFINEIFDTIERGGRDTCYVFDCLTELVADWNSDRMLSNFYLLTCPSIYEIKAVAYFSILRNIHSSHATEGIFEKAQIILDVYRDKEKLFIHPKKVHERHSSTIYTLHIWEKDSFLPVTRSATVSQLLAGIPQPWLDFTIHRLGNWTSTFAKAADLFNAVKIGKASHHELDRYYNRLMRMAVTRDKRILELANTYLDFEDLLNIRKRMIGTGLIGGKSVGMLLALAILRKNSPHWKNLLEAHDSFYIGSDVFYTYLIQNNCWWIRRKQTNEETLLKKAAEAKDRIMNGFFPRYIQEQFAEMLNYFGQAPIIVRSSSLLEDNYGNSFSGKYESVFCANQGTPNERLEAFINAVRMVYASTVSKEALLYRAQKGLLESDEQMALLVQRVSGDVYDKLFFPHIAGVGYSFNPFVWNSEIDPQAGMLRLVFGLGTRAVERHDDDYTRIVALNAPGRRPESNFDEVRRFAQQKVDVLDFTENKHVSIHIQDIIKQKIALPLELFTSRDYDIENRALERGIRDIFSRVLTFDELLSGTSFVRDMKEMLSVLQEAYKHPVDIEFTANFLADGTYRINLLQCRPFQVKIAQGYQIESREKINDTDIIFETSGPVLGNSVMMPIHRILYIVPSEYVNLSQSQRYELARIIGTVTRFDSTVHEKILLMGPGRWGTTTPALGVPVSFAEINKISVLCEITLMHEGLVADMSLGTHFYNNLVEMDMVYIGIQPARKNNFINNDLLLREPNLLQDLFPDLQRWSNTLKVIQATKDDAKRKIYLHVDALKQEAVCYFRYA